MAIAACRASEFASAISSSENLISPDVNSRLISPMSSSLTTSGTCRYERTPGPLKILDSRLSSSPTSSASTGSWSAGRCAVACPSSVIGMWNWFSSQTCSVLRPYPAMNVRAFASGS